jgi:hypothetical protein
MAGFRNIRDLGLALTDSGKTWISTFRKVPAATATIAGQWFDYGYAAGNPIPNYYAASPLVAATLEADKGIIVPRMAAGSTQWLHRFALMSAGATSSTQPFYLNDYLMYYPFVDMDAAGEDQVMDNTVTLPRYSDGVGVQMMVVAQSGTVGGGRFAITYTGSDDVQYVTQSLFCGAAQPSGAIVSAAGAVGGLLPFVPLNAGVKGVKRVDSVNFTVANGGLCCVVLVKPLDVSQTLESCSVAGIGSAVEKEALRLRGGIVEIKDGAFLAFMGQGVAGSVASAPLVGTVETVWS